MDRRFLIAFVACIAALAIVLALFIYAYFAAGNHYHFGPAITVRIEDASRNTTMSYYVYTAQTLEEQLNGLMNYTFSCNIPNNCINGELFIFSNESQQCFWMENTPEPLTQIWIDANGVVTAIYNATPESTAAICHDGNYVLELYRNLPGNVSVGDLLTSGLSH